MKKSKKHITKMITVTFACTLCAVLFAACGSTQENTEEETTTTAVEEATGEDATTKEDTTTEETTTKEAATDAAKEETDGIIMAEDDPDFTTMSTQEWTAYEFHKDYATVISDVTSYSHDDLRKLLNTHWQSYIALTNQESDMTEEARIQMLTDWHNTRMSITPISDPESKRIYLWKRGEVPSVTEYTENTGYAHADDPGFEPYMLECLVDAGTQIKGAVVLFAGGGHMYRSNVEETYEVADVLNSLGYQCFIVNYRIDPYTDQESALDVARAIRMVRANADKYSIDADNIAAAGFSYGGIVASDEANDYYGNINASALVDAYVPDEIDQVDATMNAYLAIYSVTPDEITNKDFPATFFAFGGDDPTVHDWALTCFDNCRALGITTEIHIFAGVPHGFGAGTHADGTVYANASTWPVLADSFMQNLYTKADAVSETGETDVTN